jgi:hypothetical protein
VQALACEALLVENLGVQASAYEAIVGKKNVGVQALACEAIEAVCHNSWSAGFSLRSDCW